MRIRKIKIAHDRRRERIHKDYDTSKRREIDWSSYWTTHLFGQDDLNLWVKEGTRDGLTLPNSLGGDPVTILMPCYMSVDRTENYTLASAKNAGTVYSIYWRGRCDDTTYNYLLSSSTTNFGLWFSKADRKWFHKAGNVSVASGTNTLPATLFTDNAFHDFCLVRNGTAVNFYIDGAAQGVELTLTSSEDFIISTLFKASYGMKYISECKIFSTVKTPAAAKADVPDSNWFIFGSNMCTDVLTGERLAGAVANGFDNTYYSDEGSQYTLNYGYTLYTRNKPYGEVNGFLPDLYKPYKSDGTPSPIGNLSSVSHYDADSNHAGNATNHNLADCYVNIPGAFWDRSDETIWSDKARVAIDYLYGKYDSENPNRWHISELNQATLILYANGGYKARGYVKVSDNSYDSREILKEIISYSANLTGNDILKVFQYTGDTGVHAIDYYLSNTHICATYEDKQLAFDGTDTLSLSTDGGKTFPTTLQIVGMEDMIQFAYIWENGNIHFCTHTKVYFSDDSLATYSEITPKNADGTDAVLATYDNFRPLTLNQRLKMSDVEVVFIGRYTTAGDYDKVTAWRLKDDGTIKIIYRNSVTAPILSMDHIHAMSVNETTGDIIMQTGDNANKTHWLKGSYNVVADTCAWTLIVTDTELPTNHQTDGIVFDGSDAYVTTETYNKIVKVPYATMSDVSKWVTVRECAGVSGIWNIVGGKWNGEMIFSESPVKNTIVTSTDKVHFISHYIPGVTPASNNTFLTLHPKNGDGYYLTEIWAATEELIQDINRGQVAFFKIIKPDD